MFTEYVRDTAVPSWTTVTQGDTSILSVENIYSKHTIGNTLNIHLREKEGVELGWVRFEQGSPTKVIITPPVNTAPGVYQIMLQSFDNAGVVKTTLREEDVI